MISTRFNRTINILKRSNQGNRSSFTYSIESQFSLILPPRQLCCKVFCGKGILKNKPKIKFKIETCRLRTRTIMKVRELLRKSISANGAANINRPPPTTMMVSIVPPNRSIKKKSAVRPRNDVSSNSLQYLAKKNI